MEPVIAWPKPAMEWARTEGVLAAFVRGNVEAYRRERHILFEHFPEVRSFMDRHCGYHILMEALGRRRSRRTALPAQFLFPRLPTSSQFRARTCASCSPRRLIGIGLTSRPAGS
jgi:hypothetical protein